MNLLNCLSIELVRIYRWNGTEFDFVRSRFVAFVKNTSSSTTTICKGNNPSKLRIRHD
jgi:hypothetical protein